MKYRFIIIIFFILILSTSIKGSYLSNMFFVENKEIVKTQSEIKPDYYKKHFLFANRLPFSNVTTKEFDNNKLNQTSTKIPKISKDSISIIGVGDMMLGTNYPSTL